MRTCSELTNKNARAILLRFREQHKSMYEEENTDVPECVLATYVANMLPMANVWLQVVGPPSSGKTTALELLSGLPQVVNCGSMTAASLLSGSPNREKTAKSTGGVLREIGERGVLVLKDFSSILCMRSEKQQEVITAFREIYDGRWTRSFGSDGGKTETWTGKVGVIGAVTEAIDQKAQQMAIMGERFLYYRMPVSRDQSVRIARRALEGEATRKKGLAELNNLVKAMLGLLAIPEEPIELPQDVNAMLISLACFVARCRTGIDRNSYSREIESVPNPEEPARIVQQLKTLFCALLLIGNTPEEAWQKVRKVGLSSIQDLRLKAMLTLRDTELHMVTSSIATECNSPTTTTRRALEDLFYLGVVERLQNDRTSEAWHLPALAKEELDGILGELSNEEIPFQMEDLLGADDSPEFAHSSISNSSAHKDGRIRVSAFKGDETELAKITMIVNENVGKELA
jgi:hypothetical protein